MFRKQQFARLLVSFLLAIVLTSGGIGDDAFGMAVTLPAAACTSSSGGGTC